MRWICLCFVAVAVLARIAAAQYGASPTVASLPNCTAALILQAELPPLEAGVIQEIKVTAGQHVTKGELLVQLDDIKAQKELDVAQAKLEAANTKFMAASINVDYANAARDVADAEYKVNEKANTDVPGSVPKVRMSELLLKCTETKLAIKKAVSDQELAKDEAKVAAAEVAAAKVMVERHTIISPIAGEVIDIHSHMGEAVQPAQAVIQVVNLDSLWVQTREVSPAKFARSELLGQDVTVNFEITRGEKRSLPGKVDFVNPTTEPGGTYMVRAKVDNVKLPNDSWLLSPGMHAEMSIQLGKLPPSTTSR